MATRERKGMLQITETQEELSGAQTMLHQPYVYTLRHTSSSPVCMRAHTQI